MCTATDMTNCLAVLHDAIAQVRAPMPPAYMFVIDASVSAVACGMLAAVVEGIRRSLDRMAENERTMVGFLTFDSTLHFYNLKAGLTQPQMLVSRPQQGNMRCMPELRLCLPFLLHPAVASSSAVDMRMPSAHGLETEWCWRL